MEGIKGSGVFDIDERASQAGEQAPANQGLITPSCQPATYLVGDLRGRDFGELCGLLAVSADPELLVERIADEFNPMDELPGLWLRFRRRSRTKAASGKYAA